MDQKTGCLNIKKSRQPKVVGVELIAGGDLNRSEKPGWSAGDMDKLPRKLLRHPVSPKGVLLRLKIRSSHPRTSHPISIHANVNYLYVFKRYTFLFYNYHVASYCLKVQSCKLHNNKYMITSIQITNTEIFAFIAVLVFELLSCKVLFINRKDNRNC